MGTVKKSIAAIFTAWFLRKDRQVCKGGLDCLTIYLASVDSAASQPSSRDSDWMPRAPQVGFSWDMRRMRVRLSGSTFGATDRSLSGRGDQGLNQERKRYGVIGIGSSRIRRTEYPGSTRADYHRDARQAPSRNDCRECTAWPEHTRVSLKCSSPPARDQMDFVARTRVTIGPEQRSYLEDCP